MSDNGMPASIVDEFLAMARRSTGSLHPWLLGPDASGRRAASAERRSSTPEINAWIVISPDDTVTIRIAQTELGQGVWTSNAMMVCEELQCDWSKVRPQYASANRDAREKAPEWTLNVMGNGATDPKGGGEPGFGNRDRTGVAGIPDSLYRRMRTNAASSVKDGRYYLQLAGAEARERLLLAAAELWSVPVAELTAKDSVITHARSGRTTTYGQDCRSRRPDAASESGDDHDQVAGPVDADGDRAEEPRRARQGRRQGRLRDRRSRSGHEVGRREGLPGLWRHREELQLRRDPPNAGRALRHAVPDSGSGADPRPHLQRRRRRRCRPLVSGQDRAGSHADRVGNSAGACGVQHRQHARGASCRRSISPAECASIRAMWTTPSLAPPKLSKQPTRRRICRARGWSPATPRCSSPTIASTSGWAIRARRKSASAPRRSRAFPSRTST